MVEQTSTTPGELSGGCPLDPVLNFLALKWLVHIVWLLGRVQTIRFAELQRQLPGVSAKVLSARLKQLEMLTLVEREDKGTSPPHVIYRLTPYGRSINEFLAGIELDARQLQLPKIARNDSAKNGRQT
jgi:DNA-binding HxlR family transcriptional regulator